ncbi:MAG: peptidylprolyl isomerase, partial [Gemmatimonadota bacterium]
PTVQVLEILVATADGAGALRRQVEAGAPMDSLARVHNTREATRRQGGRMWIAARENALLGPLPAVALDSPVGRLCGPLEVPGGYSLFRVEERRELPSSPFEAVRRNLQVILRARREAERMDAFLAGLRAAYRDSVLVYPEALAQVLATYDPLAAGPLAAADSVMSPEAFGAEWR